MKKEDIDEINEKCPSNQGIFFQPSMIPIHIKELVIYTRWETGGYHGGNCWGNKARYYSEEEPKNKYGVLDLVLGKLKPNISYLQYKQIEKMIQSNEDTWCEYYGNSTDWKVEYIILSELENYLNEI